MSFCHNTEMIAVILDAGCGLERHGDITLDVAKDIPVDVLHDLNIFPYPFSDKQFKHVFCSHTLEHLKYPERTLDEFIRIGEIVEIHVPYYISMTARRDKNHLHVFHVSWFQKYAKARSLRIYFRTVLDIERMSWKTPFSFQVKVWLWKEVIE